MNYNILLHLVSFFNGFTRDEFYIVLKHGGDTTASEINEHNRKRCYNLLDCQTRLYVHNLADM
jgi:hypothetical protein